MNEQAWRNYVAAYIIDVPEEKVAAEEDLIRMDMVHRMRYAAMAGGEFHPFPQLEVEEQKDEIHAAAVFEVKSELVVKDIIAKQNFTVTPAELEAEAEAMAKRQNTTVDEIRRFFGEDLAMLAGDIRRNKAIAWALEQQ